MSKILVTGSEGLIGRELVSQLEEEGHEVVGFDMVGAGNQRSVLSQWDLDKAFCDLRPEVVYHLAAVVGPRNVLTSIPKTIMVNVVGTHYATLMCSKYKVDRLIFTSTSEVYGRGLHEYLEVWRGESDPAVIESPIHPRSCYAISKLAAESLVLNAGGIVARIFNTTGPGQSTEYVLPNMINRALKGEPIQVNGDGLQTRCFCHVQDTAQALRLLGEFGYSGIWNVGSDKEITILELAEKVREFVQVVPIEFNPVLPEGSKYRRVPNLDRIRSLGWNADIPLKQIITDVSLGLNA